MKIVKPLLFLVLLISFSCTTSKKELKPIDTLITSYIPKNKVLSDEELKTWQHKDIVQDTIPGISLDRAYKELLYNQKGEEVIVAVLDTEIDIHHKDLKDRIWTNSKEIPENGVDDDKNGYIDDIHGWNFLGNDQGENIVYGNLECMRIIRKYQSEFEGKTIEDIEKSKHSLFNEFTEAKAYYNTQLERALSNQKYGNFLVDIYPKSKALLKEWYPNEDYTVKELDSLYNVYKEKDKEKSGLIYYMADYIKYNLTQEWIYNYKAQADIKFNTTYNLDYIDREITGDDPEDINDTKYGNNRVSKNLDDFYHGTLVAGLIAASRNDTIGIKGISDNIKVMPLCITSNGEEHDKDIALAIRYAVNNGAKVINMSFGKGFSLHKEWVFDALRYAAENSVLIVSSSGNGSLNLENNNYYPNDNMDNGEEVSDNFLLVGSVSHTIDENFLSYYSNYGATDVDVFAPGEKIYTTLPKNKYRYDSGTSLASAITSGVAALLWSYYPDLSASQVKHILMDSGIAYNIMVKTPANEDKEKKTPFSELSRSGKVVNAYNALLMAEQISKKK